MGDAAGAKRSANGRRRDPLGFAGWMASDPWWGVAIVAVESSFRAVFRWRLVAVENLPASGPVLLASNHVSPLDPFAVGLAGVARRRAVRYLTSAEFFDWPVGGFLLRRLKMVPIKRGAGDAGALDAAERSLARGEVVGIFPEGRIGDGDGLQRGHSGVARLALRTRVPVVPVGVWGPQRRWAGSGLVLAGPVRPRAAIAVGEALVATGDEGSAQDVQGFTDRVMAAIERAVEEARAAAS